MADQHIVLDLQMELFTQPRVSICAPDSRTCYCLPYIAGKFTIYNHSHLLGGRWRCVHIDDPRSPRFVLPSWKDCIGSKPSKIIGAQIRLLSEDDGDNEDIPDLETDEDTTSGDSPQLMVRIPVCKKRCV